MGSSGTLDFFLKIPQNRGGMKREISLQSKRFQSPGLMILYRCIIALVFILVAILIAGSVYAVVRPSDSAPLFRVGSADVIERGGQESPNSGLSASHSANGAVGVFSGIGRLRIPIAGQPPATVILSISFPYPLSDRVFAEELASRIGEFRSIATGFFAALSMEKIKDLDEDAAKAEILGRYNALLRLGKIETLYFSDLLVVD